MNKRVYLVTGSIVAHAAVAIGLYVSGAWSIEGLDHDRTSVSLAVMLPPPPAASGSPVGTQSKITPKPKVVVKGPTQPPVVHIDKTPIATATTAQGNGLGTTTGNGDNPDGKPDDTGTCIGLDCGPVVSTTPPPKQPEIVIPKVQTAVIPPTTLGALRTSGETTITPNDQVKLQMIREDHKKAVGAFKVCIDGGGGISSVGQLTSTGYPSYDAALSSGIRSWRYRPYLVNGQGTPACAVVTFVYSIK